jgi:uncharacterized phage-associated protein
MNSQTLTKNEKNLINHIVLDVAGKNAVVSKTKVIKLAYYCHARMLVASNGKKKIFTSPPEAWDYGPVFPEVYSYLNEILEHSKLADRNQIDTTEFSKELQNVYDDVMNDYSSLSGFELSDLTHDELPWIEAYNSGHVNSIISNQTILEFYTKQKENA